MKYWQLHSELTKSLGSAIPVIFLFRISFLRVMASLLVSRGSSESDGKSFFAAL